MPAILEMAAVAHIGTFKVASISEMSCFGMIIMSAEQRERHKFKVQIFVLSAGLLVHF